MVEGAESHAAQGEFAKPMFMGFCRLAEEIHVRDITYTIKSGQASVLWPSLEDWMWWRKTIYAGGSVSGNCPTAD